MKKLLLGVISFLASAFLFPVLAQTSSLSCEFHMFAVDPGYQLPYRYDSPEIANSSTINPDTYYVYSFIVKTNNSDRKSLTNVVFQQVKGVNEPLEILEIRPQNGSCQIDKGTKSATCNLNYSFTDSAHYPIEYLVKIKGSPQENTTSSLFAVTTANGTAQCANWLRIKPAQTVINPVIWETPYASLKSSDFYIRIGNQKFYGQEPISVRSDPGLDRTTLELTWQEKGVEMRLYLYFQKAANNMWELYEIRSYNGQSQGDWIYYQDSLGNIVTSLIGMRDYRSERTFKPTNGQDAEIYCKACEINALMPSINNPSVSGYSVTPLIGLPKGEIITVSTDPQTGYGVNVVLLDQQNQPVVDQSGFNYSWAAENPQLIRLTANGNHVDLQGLSVGTTNIKIDVIQNSDQKIITSTSFPVKVIDANKLAELDDSENITQPTVEQEELIKVKRDLERLSQDLQTQKIQVSYLQKTLDSIKQFLSKIFGGIFN